MRVWKELAAQLAAREAAGNFRSLRTAPAGCTELSSNDYLRLAQHPEVVEGAIEAARTLGTGATASRLVSGHSALHEELELALARFKGTEAALVFPTGYMANLGTVGGLCELGAFVACHKRSHASLVDAVRLAAAMPGTVARFYETNEKLELLLRGCKEARCLIVTDGVFSMDGDLADLPALLQLAEEYDALLVLDDAHGTGTLGASGRGLTEHFGIHSERIVHLGTLSKALGSQGGFVAGPQVLIDLVVNSARSFIYTTGLNPPAVGAALAALRLVEREPERVRRLQANGVLLRGQLRANGVSVPNQPTPIVPIILGSSAAAVERSQRLLERGFWCPAIRPPTVPEGTARLRLTVSSQWSEAQIPEIVRAVTAL